MWKSTVCSAPVPAIVQLRPDGSSDHDFGDRGTLLLGPLPDENVMENGSADTVALRRDGTLVVGVTYSRSTVHSTHLISLLSNGDPNPRFGPRHGQSDRLV